MVADYAPRPRKNPVTAVGMAPVGADVLADPDETARAFARHLGRTSLSPSTVDSYTTAVRALTSWMVSVAGDRLDPTATFTDPLSRDFALRDWQRWMLYDRRLAPGTADTYLAGANALFVWLGLGPSTVDRVEQDRDADAPTRMTPEQDRDVMRAAERRGPRDLAIVALMRLNGLRIGEVHALNTDDFALTARTGPLQVRGKGMKARTVHMGSRMRDVLRAWEAERRTWGVPADQHALFVTRTGTRMAARSLRYVVDEVGKAAGIDLHPHALRHQFAHAYLAGGGLVSELQVDLGHESLATTAIYTRPTADERAASTARATPDW